MFSYLGHRWRPPIQVAPLPWLLVVPILLAIATIVALFVHSDVNVAMLWSQCHSHARIPALSRIPIIGTPLCGLTSFFHAALDSLRTTAVMAVILAAVGALCTVCTLEAARPCNASSPVIRNPTPSWLLFNLLGGAAVWQLVIVPAFLIRAKSLLTRSREEVPEGEETGAAATASLQVTEAERESRAIPDTEAVAIPIGVTLGYYLPSILMLAFNSYATIVIWLFFPLYVSLVRQAVRWTITKVRTSEPRTVHPESTPPTLAFFYTIPVVFSILAHVLVIYNTTLPDDRTEMTRSAIKFIEIDFQFIAVTVLYWVLVEVGVEVPLVMIGSSIAVGPGAGICLGWLLRDKVICDDFGQPETEPTAAEGESDEQTPLLRS